MTEVGLLDQMTETGHTDKARAEESDLALSVSDDERVGRGDHEAPEVCSCSGGA